MTLRGGERIAARCGCGEKKWACAWEIYSVEIVFCVHSPLKFYGMNNWCLYTLDKHEIQNYVFGKSVRCNDAVYSILSSTVFCVPGYIRKEVRPDTVLAVCRR
jgi:hypothetical protein